MAVNASGVFNLEKRMRDDLRRSPVRLFGPTVVALATAMLILNGCIFKEVKDQQKKLDALCTLQGQVRTEKPGRHPLVVVLVRLPGKNADAHTKSELADHFVLEEAGRWFFLTSPGTYRLAAFEDRNANLVYEPGEPVLAATTGRIITCAAESRIENLELVIPAAGSVVVNGPLDIAQLQVRSFDDQLRISLGAATAVGEVVSLDDPRFSTEHAGQGLWRPFDFLLEAHPGVYFLEPYSSQKTPVLFVHGANGTPTDFRYLIEQLDRSRFQPWVYYYPSGAHLGMVADHLDQTVKRLQLQYDVKRLLLVAHSMGGLVSRGFLLRNQTKNQRVDIPLFVSISTPWGGMPSAAEGVKHAPTVVRAWYDLAPGSAYLRELFYRDPDRTTRHRSLPQGTNHYLLFGFQRNNRSFGESDDHTVSVVSQLYPPAQQDAARLYGFDATHESILKRPEVSSLVNRLLDEAVQHAGGV
jgi:pimeloyl-ACP methyl ester carboxylesterase